MKAASIFMRRVAVILLLSVVAVATWTSRLDRSASESLEAGMTRAFVTFATARGLNAAISVMQGTEVSGGVGVSATFSVGQALDPVNDLVEQFANLMLLATVSFGIQEVLLLMGQAQALKVLLTLLLAAWGAWYLSGRANPSWLNGLIILGLMARFAIPVATLGTEKVFENFLEERYAASESAISRTSTTVRAMTSDMLPSDESEDSQEQGWLEESWNTLKQATQSITAQDKVDALRRNVGDMADNIVRLIVVFLLQTLIVPLAILWVFYVAVRNVLGYSGRRTDSRRPDAPPTTR